MLQSINKIMKTGNTYQIDSYWLNPSLANVETTISTSNVAT